MGVAREGIKGLRWAGEEGLEGVIGEFFGGVVAGFAGCVGVMERWGREKRKEREEKEKERKAVDKRDN